MSAFREGLLKAVNEFAGKSFDGDDVREGMVGAIAIRLKDPVFESQTKNKLGNTEIRNWVVHEVKDAVTVWLHKNPKVANELVEKIAANERLRKELNVVKKLARERAKAITIRIPQLKDCKNHFDEKKAKGQESSIFLTEGQSAAGSIVRPRRQHPGGLHAQGQAAQRLGPQARRHLQERRDVQPHARARHRGHRSRGCATTRSSSPPTPTWTACTSAIC